jgi:hypothetical protein
MIHNGESVSGKKPLIILGFSVIILLLLVAWSLSKIGAFGESFRVEKAVICPELDPDRKPADTDSKNNVISYGTRQICLWFQYAGAQQGDNVKITWYSGGKSVFSEPVTLLSAAGTRSFYFIKEDGSMLPVGDYHVTITTPTRKRSEIKFSIVKNGKSREVLTWQRRNQKKQQQLQQKIQQLSKIQQIQRKGAVVQQRQSPIIPKIPSSLRQRAGTQNRRHSAANLTREGRRRLLRPQSMNARRLYRKRHR